MNIKATIALFALLFLLLAAGFACSTTNQVPETQNAPIAQLLPPMPTGTATPEPSPTVGHLATQEALINQIATQQAQIAAANVALAEIERQKAELETRRVEAEAEKERAKADAAAQNAIAADAMARAEDARARQAAEQNQSIMLNAEQIKAEAQLRQADTQRVMVWVMAVPLALIGIGLIMLARRNAADDAAANAQAGDDDVSAEPEAPDARNVRIDYRRDDGYGHVEIGNPPGDAVAFTIFAYKVRGGHSLAKDAWEGKDSPYTRDSYRPVYNWMWEHKFVEFTPGAGIRLTPAGETYLDAWLDSNYNLLPTDVRETANTENSGDFSQPSESQPPERAGEVGGGGDKDA